MLLLTGGYVAANLEWVTQVLQPASPHEQAVVSPPAPPHEQALVSPPEPSGQAAPVTEPQIVSIEKPGPDSVAVSTSVNAAAVESTTPREVKTDPPTPPAMPAEVAAQALVAAPAGPSGQAEKAAPVSVTGGTDRTDPPSEPALAATQPQKSKKTRPESSLAQAPSPPDVGRSSGPSVEAVKVASQEPPSSVAPEPLGPQSQEALARPEGEPDLQGRVSGAKRLDEIEIAGRWIKLFGIVDRARGAREADHVQALLRYLKPAQNVLVCYRKPRDTYRCYAAGKDIAQLALADGMVQPAPNAPAEYRAGAQKKR